MTVWIWTIESTLIHRDTSEYAQIFDSEISFGFGQVRTPLVTTPTNHIELTDPARFGTGLGRIHRCSPVTPSV